MTFVIDRRGSGVAADVTPQGWRDFNANLTIAANDLEKSYQLDPGDPIAATQMLTVLMGRSAGLANMETWFKRAMDADPDNLDACYAKMHFLKPKWGGDAASMLQFGRQCLEDGNYVQPRIALMLVEMLDRFSPCRPPKP